MDIGRVKRYKDKLDLIRERIGDIETWIDNLTIGDFLDDKKTRLAVYKATQEIVESAMDICAMMIKDLKLIPKDDYTNINVLYNHKIMDGKLKSALTEANGLRNRLIHRYNVFNEEIVFGSIKELLPSFKDFAGLVSKWLKRIS
ncbi:MAG: DUF86 domain-containing protein [Candidatus Hydrothermarchaeales archaeon]